MKKTIRLTVNGEDYTVSIEPFDTLNKVLREYLGLTGTKKGCDYGGCGSCTVIVDGRAVYSCMFWAGQADGRKITTIEGLVKNGELDPIQEAFIQHGAVQCGYCTPGMIMSTKALLDKKSNFTEMEAREAIAGNLCRCTGYVKIVSAMMSLAKKSSEG
ncbi:(2Fe-2S)-binding protein [Candidatus Hecatella orcuttiae]|uniref:(2Fe-2S)-binding protein n=1 Tax=Candidatus Hecatella orcuttiae TaxID=1935119 RepID=UPI002867FA97|nr:2Fe-2S iron-sulfur cluster-binding protein [Candidatus Hecatella orcuttiae]